MPNLHFVSYNKSNINPSNGIKEALDLEIWWPDKSNDVYTIKIVYQESKITGIDDKNLLYNPDKLYEQTIFTITGFKIVDAINNQLIIEPIGDKKKIVIEDKINNNTNTNDLLELNKSEKSFIVIG